MPLLRMKVSEVSTGYAFATTTSASPGNGALYASRAKATASP